MRLYLQFLLSSATFTIRIAAESGIRQWMMLEIMQEYIRMLNG